MPLYDILLSLLCGFSFFFLTTCFTGEKKATYLPVGALFTAMYFSPFYFCIPVALIGHLVAIAIIKIVNSPLNKMKVKKQTGGNKCHY